MIGKNQIGKLRSFVRIAREAHLERHLRHRGAKSHRLRKRECRIGPAHHQQRDTAGVHALGESAQLRRRRHSIEAQVSFVRLDRDPDIAVRLIESVRGEGDFQSIHSPAPDDHHARCRRGELTAKRIEHRGAHARGLRGRLDRKPACEHAHDRHLAARPAVDPLVGVETGERAARSYINKSRGIVVIGARIGEIELLRHQRAPAVEEIRTNRNHQSGGVEIEPWPGDAVALSVCRDHRVIGARVVAQMSGHSEAREPRVEEAGETSRLVLIDEDRVSRAPPAACLSELLRKDLQRFVPNYGLEAPIPSNHRPAIAIGIVKTLQGRLASRAKRASVHRVVRVALELDRTSVTGLGYDAARCGAFTAGRRVIGRYAGYGLVRRNQIWNEPLDFLGRASQHRSGGGADAQHLEEFAALDSIRCGACGGRSFLLDAHSTSSDTSCSRISRGRADSTVRCDN